MEKLKMHTPNLADENFKKLSVMFPNAVTETVNENGEIVRAIDVDMLQQEISGTIIAGGGRNVTSLRGRIRKSL
jgi:adenine-specific DNA-methyltransferase